MSELSDSDSMSELSNSDSEVKGTGVSGNESPLCMATVCSATDPVCWTPSRQTDSRSLSAGQPCSRWQAGGMAAHGAAAHEDGAGQDLTVRQPSQLQLTAAPPRAGIMDADSRSDRLHMTSVPCAWEL